MTSLSQYHDRQLTQATMQLSGGSFKSVWNHSDDAAYDDL